MDPIKTIQLIDGLCPRCHRCLEYRTIAGPQRRPLAVAVITFEAICGLKSEVDHMNFPAQTESIEGQYSTKAVSSVVSSCGPF